MAHLEVDWLKRWSRYAPSSIALMCGETLKEVSYGMLYKLSTELANHLAQTFDIKKGDRIAVLSTNEWEFVPLFFAAQRLGAILVPVNFRLTSREIDHILSDSGAKLLIYQNSYQETIMACSSEAKPKQQWLFDTADGLIGFLKHVFDKFSSDSSVHNKANKTWEIEMRAEFEDPCMIIYTSGTTGAPKGALITHSMLFWNSVNTTLRLNLNQSDVTVGFLPFFHTGGWNVLLTPFLHRGAKTIFVKKFDPRQILKLSEKFRATILFGVPTTMDLMYHTPEFTSANLSSIRYAIVGGEPMSVDLIKAWQNKGIPIRQGYGLTEFGPNVFSLNEEDSIRKIGSIGFPNFYIDVKVVDNDNRALGPNEIGELVLRGPVCMQGYWQNAKATSDTIKDGWLHTGDLVRFDGDGYFYVAGRKKDMYKSGGENVYPVEIEQILSAHPKIREVAVVGIKDEKWGEVGRAYIALNADAKMSEQEILDYCGAHLAKFKIPKSVVFLSELPKGDSGKILKRKLTNPD